MSSSIKTVKTITCHGVYNYGASLQELALLEFLTDSGFQATSISYKPTYLSSHHELFACQNPRWNENIFTRTIYILLKIPEKLLATKRRAAFDNFSKLYIPTTQKVFRDNNELKSISGSADAFICGSDQIWNPKFENGTDPAFYLDFCKSDVTKVSYAASFAVDELPEGNISFVKEMVSKIDYVSVRETSGRNILSELGFAKVTQVLDPVFLLSRSYWSKFVNSPSCDKYIFVYDFDNNPMIQEIATRLSTVHGFKIYTVNKNIKYSDMNYFNKGPECFVDLVANAELVLTTSFHALAFSIIFKRKFGVFNRKIAINTRMRDLLEILGLSKYLFSSDGLSIEEFDVDYSLVKPALDSHLLRSKSFLLNALDK